MVLGFNVKYYRRLSSPSIHGPAYFLPLSLSKENGRRSGANALSSNERCTSAPLVERRPTGAGIVPGRRAAVLGASGTDGRVHVMPDHAA
jgi:hypothetical protein